MKIVSCETLLRRFLLILPLFLCLCATSCGVDYTEQDVKTAVAELVSSSMELNEIYFGEGLPISDDREDVERFYASFASDIESINYHPVAEDCPYQSIADIKEATELVFSPEYCEYLYELAFQGISALINTGGEDPQMENALFARYIETNDMLTVRLNIPDEAMDLSRTYDFSAITVTSMKKSSATVTVPSTKNGVPLTIELKLVLTEDGFRLDSPTY